MKRIYLLLLIAAGLLGFGPAQAEVKIGVVNVAEVLEAAPQSATAQETLRGEFASREAELSAERDAIAEMEERLQRDGEVMSEENRVALEQDILEQKGDLNRDLAELQEDFTFRRNEELAEIEKDIVAVIQRIAEEGDYDLVITDRVLYVSDRIDITDEVIDGLQ